MPFDQATTPGKRTLTTPVATDTPGVPGKETLVGRLPSHVDRPSTFRNPADEVPCRWGDLDLVHLVAPRTLPLDLRQQPDCPWPKDGVREGSPQRKPGGVLITHEHSVRRQEAWDEYRQGAAYVDHTQQALVPKLAAFHRPVHLPPGFDLGTGGDLVALTCAQHRAGVSVAQLFPFSGSPQKMTALRAHGVVDHLGVTKADATVQVAMHRLRAAGARANAAGERLKAAYSALAVATDEKAVASAEKHVQDLKDGRQSILSVIDFLTEGPEKVHKLIGTVLSAAADPTHIVALCGTVLRSLPIEGMQAAMDSLRAARETLATAKDDVLNHNLSAAAQDADATLDELIASRAAVVGAVAERQTAYNQAGKAAEDPRLNRAISAIPLVEYLVGVLREIAELARDASPPCSDAAALGFGIAMASDIPQIRESARNLPLVIGQVLYVHVYYAALLDDWLARLKQLRDTYTSIVGCQSGGDM